MREPPPLQDEAGEETGEASGRPGEGTDSERPPGEESLGKDAGADPWSALAGLGEILAGALAVARDPEGAQVSPLVEREPGTGRLHLKIPIPGPETAARIGEALGALAEALRGMSSPGQK